MKVNWYPAYIGIGSNLENPILQVKTSFTLLAQIPKTVLISQSSLYLSKPFGIEDQPDFINAAASVITQLTAFDLLKQLQKIENECGRKRSAIQWGPRTLDLDLLIYSDQILDEMNLIVPHPGISERNFVLLPLGELAPELYVPKLGRIRNLISNISKTGISQI
ncbi:MAG: 2-amino-4-hydroxy-6-hydroxymethyldihydropteridine diphosphokinase [Gammaproteobacteria bacterium]|nr:2-amino-4-hydroxy-6-hydroxymethyldihydropteridine diphosphokinase [Gammaproteobacteria bacterium]|tara:strand:- start:2962 stop:3453 length:492 start_codon:yes stop_codon:yes gene_type:complete